MDAEQAGLRGSSPLTVGDEDQTQAAISNAAAVSTMCSEDMVLEALVTIEPDTVSVGRKTEE